MIKAAVARVSVFLQSTFPERHLYLRTAEGLRGIVLSTRLQASLAAAALTVVCWTLICTLSLIAMPFMAANANAQTARTQRYYERMIADRDARLDRAVAELASIKGPIEQMALNAERRNAALVLLLNQGGRISAPGRTVTPAAYTQVSGSPLARLQGVENAQDQLLNQAESFAKARADQLRLIFHMAGLDENAFRAPVRAGGEGGPLIEGKDAPALAAELNVDPDFAARIQHAAQDLTDLRTLSSAVGSLPLAQPTADGRRTSGFGVRIDPINGRPAFHPGQDFAGALMTPIHATGPGVVSYAGWRGGYGQVVEIDHGHGLKTRYAHLAVIKAYVGEPVTLGERIGLMGSTGRSTGPHLHYEVWIDGRVQNPDRFLEAGKYVQQATY